MSGEIEGLPNSDVDRVTLAVERTSGYVTVRDVHEDEKRVMGILLTVHEARQLSAMLTRALNATSPKGAKRVWRVGAPVRARIGTLGYTSADVYGAE